MVGYGLNMNGFLSYVTGVGGLPTVTGSVLFGLKADESLKKVTSSLVLGYERPHLIHIARR